MTSHSLRRPTDEDEVWLVTAAVAGDEVAFARLADRHRRALRAHCRRRLGSATDADDAVQETLLRAWRWRRDFEGRSSFGWWLRRIATNACTDLAARAARTPTVSRPERDDEGGGGGPAEAPTDDDTDPAAVVAEREAVELAYLVAIRTLPARQRVVLVLRDVLRYSAADTASLLGATVPSVNSALQRARAALAHQERPPTAAATAGERALLRRFVDAHVRADVAALVATLDAAAARRGRVRVPRTAARARRSEW